MLAGALSQLADRGVLRVADPDVAAEQFTWLVIAAPLNRVTRRAARGPTTTGGWSGSLPRPSPRS